MIPFRNNSARPGDIARLLASGVSVAALCVMSATPAFAQTGSVAGAGSAGASTTTSAAQDDPAQTTDTSGGGEEIVVTGIRQSLANAQNIKRNSDTVVDAITAQDIGALPDRSVTEALQRVPGVAINRFAGSNDPDHFSVEGSGVVVRGLNFVRSEFNGRDTFSAGVYGQAINFADVPSELLGSVEVYKNATAAMIEGGLAGTVNLNTRVPFDNKGFHIGVDLEANYGDLNKEWSPTGSILISNTWDTGIGRMGVLANLSYSQLLSRSDGIQVTNFQTRDNMSTLQANTSSVAQCRNALPSGTDAYGLPPANPATPAAGQACGPLNGAAGADGFADYSPLQYAPLGGQFRTDRFNRERTGVAGAFQWESTDRRALLTAQYLRTDSTNKSIEHTFESAPDLSEYNTYPYGCQPNGNGPTFTTTTQTNAGTTRAECPVGSFQNYQYDSNGVFERGYITLPGSGWRAPDSGNGDPVAGWRTPTGGMQQSLGLQQIDDENIVSDYGLNFKFSPDDHWQFNLDGDYTRAEHNTLSMTEYGSMYADEELDLRGDIPVVTPHKPLWLSADWSGAPCPAGKPVAQCTPNTRINGEGDAQYLSDPANEFWRAAMDHIEHSTGTEWAFRGDIAYKFGENPFLQSLKFGGRYADRDETVRYSNYNWGRISETWAGSGQTWMDSTPSTITQYKFDNFFRGQTNAPPSGWYYNSDMIQGYPWASQYFAGLAAQVGPGGWVPLADRTGVVAGTPFLPSEIQQVSQRSADAYAMLTFGSSEPLFGGIRVSGNIGLRYVNTKVRSAGSIYIDQRSLGVDEDFATRCPSAPSTPPNAPPGTVIGGPGGICLIGPAAYAQLQQFASGVATPNVARTTNTQWLPSLNLKFELTPKLIARFAASKVMTLPDLASIRDSFSATFNNTDNTITFNLGNPYLKPATAKQFDVTLEWYFARVGSLTFDAFYKDVTNFFYANQATRSFTQNGITEPITVRIPSNYSGSGKIKGFEVAYQQTFDFLPWIFNGLGVNASYTYIESTGLPNSFLNLGGAANTSRVGTGNLPLEQLSRHTINVQGFYEKGPVSLRVAYNWRSRFLLTAADVIFPYYPIYNAAEGQMDASAFINVNKHVKIGVQGVNLLDTVTKTEQQFTDSGLLGPRSYFMNDRRFSFILRGSF